MGSGIQFSAPRSVSVRIIGNMPGNVPIR